MKATIMAADGSLQEVEVPVKTPLDFMELYFDTNQIIAECAQGKISGALAAVHLHKVNEALRECIVMWDARREMPDIPGPELDIWGNS